MRTLLEPLDLLDAFIDTEALDDRALTKALTMGDRRMISNSRCGSYTAWFAPEVVQGEAKSIRQTQCCGAR